MRRINRAYEILGDPLLLSQYDRTPPHAPFSLHGQESWQAKKNTWTEWPEGTFPRWRPSPPGAWPFERPRPELNVLQEERLWQDPPRDRELREDTPPRPTQPEKKHREREHEVPEPEQPLCMMYELRRPIPHPMRRRAKGKRVSEVDIQEQRRQSNQAAPSTHGFEPPWPWLKQPPQKRTLVEEVSEDECEDNRREFWDVFFEEHPEYLTEPTTKRYRAASPPIEQAKPIHVGAEKGERQENRDDNIMRRWAEYQWRQRTGESRTFQNAERKEWHESQDESISRRWKEYQRRQRTEHTIPPAEFRTSPPAVPKQTSPPRQPVRKRLTPPPTPPSSSKGKKRQETSSSLELWTKPDAKRDTVFIDDGAWNLMVIMPLKYNIRSAVQIHPTHEDYHVPKGPQDSVNSVTFSFTLQENLDRGADSDASVPENDLLIRILRTPNYDLYNIDTLIKGWKYLSPGDEDGYKTLILTLASRPGYSISDDVPYFFSTNLETTVAAREPTCYAATHLMFTRDELREKERPDIRVMQIEELWNDLDDAEEEETTIAKLRKYGGFR